MIAFLEHGSHFCHRYQTIGPLNTCCEFFQAHLAGLVRVEHVKTPPYPGPERRAQADPEQVGELRECQAIAPIPLCDMIDRFL